MNGQRISGSMFTVLVIKVLNESLAATAQGITEQVRTSPNFYRYAPVILDLNLASQIREPDDVRALRDICEAHELVPVGIQGGTAAQRQAAMACGLTSFPVSSHMAARGERAREVRPVPEAAEAAGGGDGGGPARLITQTVRSGTQIYAKGTDLVIAASVSPGAEVIADGHIHVYGTLRGRALAGAAGNPEARIFCRNLAAELISVSGHYMVREDIPEALQGKPVSVLLEAERLVIRAED